MEAAHILNKKFRLKIQNYVQQKHFYNIPELKFKPLQDLIYRFCLCWTNLIIYVLKLITHSEAESMKNKTWIQNLKKKKKTTLMDLFS